MTATGTAIGARLRATTRTIDAPFDLLGRLGTGGFAWFGNECCFVTAGVAARIAPEHVAATLDAVQHDASDGAPFAAGPIAVGALPFAHTSAGRMTVPARVIGVDADGRAWETTVTGAGTSTARRDVVRTDAPTSYSVDAIADRRAWREAVEAVLGAIERGPLAKVVLAREVRVRADAKFDVVALLHQLRRTQPGCFTFADDGFVGATPELLVRRRATRVTCRPMAGTVPRDSDDAAAVARLVASRKDGREHDLVATAVAEELRRSCRDVTVRGPEPARFADLTHLVTHISASTDSVSALDIAVALHPTPAVAGSPRDDALALIDALEPTDRGKYAGPVGWVNARGEGEFAVALRCAQLDGNTARLHAGAGIVAGSDASTEWDETSAKLDPMLRALVRP